MVRRFVRCPANAWILRDFRGAVSRHLPSKVGSGEFSRAADDPTSPPPPLCHFCHGARGRDRDFSLRRSWMYHPCQYVRKRSGKNYRSSPRSSWVSQCCRCSTPPRVGRSMCLVEIAKLLPSCSAAGAATVNARMLVRQSSEGYRSQRVAQYKRLLLIQWLVQLFVDCTRYVPQTARRLLAQCELPPALERVAMQAQRCSQAWFAWTDEGRAWFVVAEVAKVSGRHCQGRAIRMFFYDEDGRFVASGAWALQSAGSWILCER
jgi:hypothetical protein